jgi:hypothetical protein
VLDRLLRGRGWVMLIGLLLAGIVFLNVSVLELNRGIASTTSRAAQLEAQNSQLRTRLANVASAEAIQRAAEALGFVLPQPGDIGYLRPSPGDARAAARRLAEAAQSGAAPASAPASATPVAPTPAASPIPAAAPVSAPPAATPTSPAAPAGTSGAAATPAPAVGGR